MTRVLLFRTEGAKEVYLARNDKGGFSAVSRPEETTIFFDTLAEGYAFGGEYPVLQNWRVGWR